MKGRIRKGFSGSIEMMQLMMRKKRYAENALA